MIQALSQLDVLHIQRAAASQIVLRRRITKYGYLMKLDEFSKKMHDAISALNKEKISVIWDQYKTLYLREQISFVAIPILTISAFPLGVIYLIIYWWMGNARKCPLCKVLYASTVINSEFVSEESGYETVERRDEIRMHTNETRNSPFSNGKHVGNLIRKEQVHVNHTTRRVYYECCDCGFRWNQLEETKSS